MKQLGIKNIITIVFVVAAVAGFMVFSGVIPLGEDGAAARGNVTVWGTIPFATIQRHIEAAKEQNLTITYIEKRPDNYEAELVNALASGTAPDLFIMSHEAILRHRDKLFEIPYSSFPRVTYESTYVDEARLFLSDTGVTAFPMMVDPLVMYYNKELMSSAFILEVPAYWDELIPFSSSITEYSTTGEVNISAAALGTYDNIGNAKSIIATLLMQNENPIIGTNPTDNKKRSTLALDQNEVNKSIAALEFYTSFAQFGSNTYSWNEALVDDQNKFIAREVALYFGRASEVENIRRKNPNLDFGVALIPQVRTTNSRITHGAMTGIAISEQSKNIPAALNVASKLAGKDTTLALAQELMVAPARKDVLGDKPEDALGTLVYNSAIISRGWLDADTDATDEIFRTMVRNINTGAMGVQNAIGRASTDLTTVMNRTINTTITSE